MTSLSKRSALPPPLRLDTAGAVIPGTAMTKGEAHQRLETAYANATPEMARPWNHSAACAQGDPSSPLSPRTQLALDNNIKYRAPRVPREVLERASLAAAKSDFPYDRTPEVRANREHNKYPRHTYAKDQENGLEIFGAHIGGKLVRPGDRIVELGSGPGHYAKAVDDIGFDITAVDLDPGRKVFPGVISSSVADFARENRGKFTVAVSNHFSPSMLGGSDDQVAADAHAYVGHTATLLVREGRFLCGVSSKDPEYVSKGHSLNMEAVMKAHFEEVDIHWADKFGPEFEKYGSVGGMVAIIEGRKPRSPKADAHP